MLQLNLNIVTMFFVQLGEYKMLTVIRPIKCKLLGKNKIWKVAIDFYKQTKITNERRAES